MSSAWTAEQVLALAPDPGSGKAGQGLARREKWVTLGRDARAAWGECQGSGASPYQTQVDLAEPAFRCSCPSRKFPCKHGLGLFLLFIGQEEAFADGPAPAWVADWLKSRDARSEKKARQAEAPEAAPDPEAQARRGEARLAKVTAGVGELELWLRDLVRRGLAAAQQQPHAFWEAMAARMVDAQAPGLTRQLREMAAVPASGEGWPERLAERVGRLALLLEGFRRLDALPPETQADVRTLLGWPQREEDLAGMPGVRDRWQVLGQRASDEERLRVLRTWLRGAATGQPALVLQFAAAGQALERSLLPGTCFEGEVVFWPGSVPLRAVVRGRQGEAAAIDDVGGFPTVTAGLDAWSAALARNPWLETFPLTLAQVTPTGEPGRWGVLDREDRWLPCAGPQVPGWLLLAVSGGRPVTLFGEWDGRALLPLSFAGGGEFVGLGGAT